MFNVQSSSTMVMAIDHNARLTKVHEAYKNNLEKRNAKINEAFNALYSATPKGKHIHVDLNGIYEELADTFCVSKATVMKALKN
jgi:hypothetical protein